MKKNVGTAIKQIPFDSIIVAESYKPSDQLVGRCHTILWCISTTSTASGNRKREIYSDIKQLIYAPMKMDVVLFFRSSEAMHHDTERTVMNIAIGASMMYSFNKL